MYREMIHKIHPPDIFACGGGFKIIAGITLCRGKVAKTWNSNTALG
jgi:hypothetical protein